MKSIYTNVAAYNLWANRQLTAHLSTQKNDFTRQKQGGSFGSIRETILHIWGADWLWLQRLKGNSPTSWIADGYTGSTRELYEDWLNTSEEFLAFIEDQSNLWFEAETSFHNLAGKAFTQNNALLVHHVFNHATFHRGQVITLARQLGITGFQSIDYVTFNRMEMQEKKIVEIIDYAPEYGRHFKRINYDWITKYFKIEPTDVASLDKHQEKILDKGGHIFFAKVGEEIVGTCALIKYDADVFELAKMGVDEGFQGLNIGKLLGEAIISKAADLGAKKVFLETNQRLTPAISLYKKLGFKEVRPEKPSEYERSNYLMEYHF